MNVVDQIDRFNKLLSSTKGRDKFSKLMQYGSKILQQHYVNQIEYASDDSKQDYVSLLQKATAFDGGIATARKVMRFFNFLIGYIAFFKFLGSKKQNLDSIIDMTSKLGYSNYFLLDSFGWFAKLKIFTTTPLENVDSFSFYGIANSNHSVTYGTYAAKSWLIGIIFGLVFQIRKLMKSLSEELKLLEQKHKLSDSSLSIQEVNATLNVLYKERMVCYRTMISLFCDLFPALNNAKYAEFSKGTLGLLGSIAALIGVYECW
eukprot:gene6433-10441_t